MSKQSCASSDALRPGEPADRPPGMRPGKCAPHDPPKGWSAGCFMQSGNRPSRRNKGNTQHSATNAWAPLDYPTRDLVHVSGVPCETSGQMLVVNGRLFSCNSIQFSTLFVLSCHSLALAGKKVPITVPLTPLLSAKDILESIATYKGSPELTQRCLKWVSDEFTRAVSALRGKLEKARLNRSLIESGINKKGYRLGTAPENVTLTYLDPVTNKVVTILGKN